MIISKDKNIEEQNVLIKKFRGEGEEMHQKIISREEQLKKIIQNNQIIEQESMSLKVQLENVSKELITYKEKVQLFEESNMNYSEAIENLKNKDTSNKVIELQTALDKAWTENAQLHKEKQTIIEKFRQESKEFENQYKEKMNNILREKTEEHTKKEQELKKYNTLLRH